MRSTVTCLALVAIFGLQASAQQQTEVHTEVIGNRSAIKHAPKLGSVVGIPDPEPWNTVMHRVEINHVTPDSVAMIKQAKYELKKNLPVSVNSDNGNGRATTPQIGTGIFGTTMTIYTPPDNTVAISNEGRIVAVDNEDISYFNHTGTPTGTATHPTFFSGLTSTNASLFDPRVIYDAGADRFIYVLLHGSFSSISKIFVCFSKGNDPENDGWEIYELPGNPKNNGAWTDYPHIGVSEDELFITTNLFFNNGGGFHDAIIYQVDKQAGYNGASSIDYITHEDLFNNQTGAGFALVPASYGQQGSYGPNFYLVSTWPSGYTNNGRIFLYEVDGDINSNPDVLISNIVVSPIGIAGYASQNGTSNVMDNGDCRMHSAFFLDGVVHAVNMVEANLGYGGIQYYRIPVDNPGLTEDALFAESGFDLAYPSIASYGLSDCDKSVMIGYLRTGSTIYPEMRVVNCDNDMNWSSSTQVIAGQGPMTFGSSNVIRWGDYCTLQRKHNANDPEVWMSGCYPTTQNRYRTRIVEITGDYEAPEPPVIDFYSNDSLGVPTYFVNFYDNSTNNPNQWRWRFEGGIPMVSTQQNPLVSYLDTGTFDVTLTAWNDECYDSLTVENMIRVVNQLPSDTDTVTLGTGQQVFIVDGDTFELFNGEYVPLNVNDLEYATETKVYPNPVLSTDMLFVEFEIATGQVVEATLYDLTGKLVKNLYYDYLKPGKHELGFNRLALPPGQYVLKVSSDQKIILHESVVVQ